MKDARKTRREMRNKIGMLGRKREKNDCVEIVV